MMLRPASNCSSHGKGGSRPRWGPPTLKAEVEGEVISSLMEYPQFGGLDSQCYFKWEEKTTRALRINKVPAVDQVAKIRDNLSLHPLSMVPESTKLAKDAFSTLKSRYGDEYRLMMLRLKELRKMGPKPEQ